MIKLGIKPPAPGVLSRPKITAALDILREKFASNGAVSSKDFKKITYWTEVKTELANYQNGKCCFCERHRDPNGEADVEHFRPKNSRGDDPAPGHNGYWWLAYEWSNLYFVCKECNEKYKVNKFPLVVPGDRAFIEGDDVEIEAPVLFDLVNENPEEYILYDWVGSLPLPAAKPNDPDMRAKKTIKLLDLDNRVNLSEARGQKFINMEVTAAAIHKFRIDGNQLMLDDYIERLESHVSSKSNFSGFARFYYKSVGLSQYVDG